MAVTFRQQARVGAYLMKQKLRRRKKFPLVVELEPLFACNLACAGCGKIQYPANILKQRMTVDKAMSALTADGTLAKLQQTWLSDKVSTPVLQ